MLLRIRLIKRINNFDILCKGILGFTKREKKKKERKKKEKGKRRNTNVVFLYLLFFLFLSFPVFSYSCTKCKNDESCNLLCPAALMGISCHLSRPQVASLVLPSCGIGVMGEPALIGKMG